MDNDELQEGQTGTLKKSYLGYRHVEFVEYDYPRVRVQLSSGPVSYTHLTLPTT